MELLQNVEKNSIMITNMVEQLDQRRKEHEFRKNRLMQKIIHDWSQVKSMIFWQRCFQSVDFYVIKETYENTKALISEGYEIKNPAGFFVHTLKKMGYYPFKEVKNGRQEQS